MRWLLLALVACKGSSPTCKEVLTTPLKSLAPHAGLTACAAYFAGPCATALAEAPRELTQAQGDAIFATCASLYPVIAGDRATWFETALARDSGLAPDERHTVGMVLDTELRPSALAVHLERDAVVIDGVGRFPASDGAGILAALRAHGADAAGVLIWGSADAPETAQAFQAMLRGTHIETVGCTAQTCR